MTGSSNWILTLTGALSLNETKISRDSPDALEPFIKLITFQMNMPAFIALSLTFFNSPRWMPITQLLFSLIMHPPEHPLYVLQV